jgi:hypothetical protein
VYAAAGAPWIRSLSLYRANTGTFEQIASDTPICVVAFRSLLITSAALETSSKRASFSQS